MFKDPTLDPFLHGRGYEAPATFGFNLDAPTIDIGASEQEEDWEWEPVDAIPAQIVLRIRLKEIPLSTSLSFFNPTVQYIQDGQALKATSLYGPQASPDPLHKLSQHQAIELLYTGEGFYEKDGSHLALSASQEQGFAISLSREDSLYTKPYRTEEAPHVTETKTAEGSKRVLRPFGGFWDGNVETAEQIYYEISEDYPEQTRITLFSSSRLSGDCLFLLDPTDEERVSLAEAIHQGFARFTCLQGSTETRYCSFDYVSKAPNIIDVIFVPASS